MSEILLQAQPGQLPRADQWGGILAAIAVVVFGPIVLSFVIGNCYKLYIRLSGKAPKAKKNASSRLRVVRRGRRPATQPEQPEQRQKSQTPVVPRSAGNATPLKQKLEASTNVVSLGTWLQRANNMPDKTPHMAVVGPSGSGKSQLVLAILATRLGRITICTPKSQRADPWGGFPAVRLRRNDMSFEPIAEAISAVYNEMLRRNAADADVEDDWLTLVIDELSTVTGKIPESAGQILDLVTMGRSCRIRVILIATEANVKAWGWEGRSEARHNCLFVECQEDTYRAWMYRWGKEREEIATDRVLKLAQSAQLESRAWTPPVTSSTQLVETSSSTSSNPVAVGRTWSADHMKVAIWLAAEPAISTRELARRLYGGRSGGDWSRKAQAIREQVSSVFGEALAPGQPTCEDGQPVSAVSAVSSGENSADQSLTRTAAQAAA